MFKTTRARNKFIRRLALTLWASFALIDPVHAEPITITLFGTAFASTIGGAIVSTMIGAAATYLVSLAFDMFKPPGEENETEVKFGERVSRNGALGVNITAGHQVHYNEYDDAKQLQMVHILADAWCDGLEAIYINNKRYAVNEIANSGNNEHHCYEVGVSLEESDEEDEKESPFGFNRKPDKNYKDLIKLRFHDGRPGQLADTNLINKTPGWDDKKRYTGMCYVVSDIKSDKNKFNGIPDIKFVFRGMRWYDLRKDSSAGGFGSHRFNDPSTWEYTRNVGVAAYHFLRGYFLNGKRILGAGLSVADIDVDTLVAFMNVCDETLTTPGGATRKRYEGNFLWNDTDAYSFFLDRVCKVAAGFYAEKQGRIALFAGKAQAPVMTITDEDLAEDEPVEYNDKRSGSDLFTGIHGTYTHSEDFQPVPYSSIEPNEFAFEDGTESLQDYNLEEIQDPHQAYMVAKAILFQTRLQASASVVLDVKDIILELGDWVVWASKSSLRGTKTYRIMGTSLNLQTMRLQLRLQEISNFAYSDSSTAADLVEPVRNFLRSGYLSELSSFAVSPTATTGPDKESIPGLKITYAPVMDAAVSAIDIRYRKKTETNDADIVTVQDPSPYDGFFVTTNSVAPKTLYEAQYLIRTLPGREVTWSNWVTAEGLTPAFNAPMDFDLYLGAIGREHLKEDLVDYQNWMADSARKIQELEERLSVSDAEINLTGMVEVQRTRRELKAAYEDTTAEWSEAILVAVGPDSALVQTVDQTKLRLDNPQTGLEATANAVQSVTTRIDHSVTGLVASSNRIDALNLRLNNPITGLQASADGIDAIEVRINDTDTGLMASANKIISLNSAITNPITGLTANSHAVDSLETLVENPSTGLQASANKITTLNSALGGNSAGIRIRAETYAAPGGYSARIGWEASTVVNGNFRPASLFIDVPAGINDPTRVTVLAQQFVVAINENIGAVNPFIVQDNQVFIDNARIRNLTGENIFAIRINAIELRQDGKLITEMVEANAITDATQNSPSSSWTYIGDGNTAVASHKIYAKGGRVLIDASFYQEWNTSEGPNSAWFGYLDFWVDRNGTEIEGSRRSIYVDDSFTGHETWPVQDYDPGTGDVTYTIYITTVNSSVKGGGARFRARQGVLRLVNAKR